VPDADDELGAVGEPEGEGRGPPVPGSGAEDDADGEEGAPGCGGAAPIFAGASTSLGSGSRNTLRKPTSDCLTVPAEVPDADNELGAAGELEGEAEAAPGSGAGDDADEEEKDEHPASNGNSAIEAATTVSRPLPSAQCRSPSMPHLYQERAINLKAERSACGGAAAFRAAERWPPRSSAYRIVLAILITLPCARNVSRPWLSRVSDLDRPPPVPSQPNC
jgi:hypothetical protein